MLKQPKFLKALETERLRSMPNGFLPPSLNDVEGMIVLGDAMNIRHPLTGGGMTVAFNDVVLLKELLSPENIPSFTDASLILEQMSTFHWKRKKYCTAINVLAMALYRIFAADNSKLNLIFTVLFLTFLYRSRFIGVVTWLLCLFSIRR